MTLDKNRQAIVDQYRAVVKNCWTATRSVSKTVALVKGVDQTFGGTFSETSSAARP